MNRNKKKKQLLNLVVVLFTLGSFIFNTDNFDQIANPTSLVLPESTEAAIVKEYDGKNKEIVINNNQVKFEKKTLNLSNGVWQTFSDLDNLNRVGVANALIGKESFPTEERVTRLKVKPTGWKQKRIGKGMNDWLYNRSHLIAFRLTGENDNIKNLMTGTRTFNDPLMKKYETKITNYINLTGNHVRYRVTPYFKGRELVARGVQLEAKSVESDDFSFNVYIFNVQDGYKIDYKTGLSKKKPNV